MNAKELKEFKNWLSQHNLHTKEGGELLWLNGWGTGLFLDSFCGNHQIGFRRIWCHFGLKCFLPENLSFARLYLSNDDGRDTPDATVSLEKAKQITIDMLKEVLDANKKSIDGLMQKQKELEQVIKSMEE